MRGVASVVEEEYSIYTWQVLCVALSLLQSFGKQRQFKVGVIRMQPCYDRPGSRTECGILLKCLHYRFVDAVSMSRKPRGQLVHSKSRRNTTCWCVPRKAASKDEQKSSFNDQLIIYLFAVFQHKR